jgi:type IV pilus assembly protein PilC
MVAAGEAGGILDTILKRLATYIEKHAKLVSQVRSAMIYPIVVLSIAAIVVTIILIKVIPTFTLLFEGLNAQLPWMTRAVIWASQKLVVALPFILIAMGAGVYGLRRFYQTANGRMRIDSMLLRMPLVGKIIRKVAVARFCRTLGTLLSSGVPILDGLEITAKTAGNAVIESAIRTVRGRIERGETIAVPLRSTGVFPPMVAQMIGAGESTGALDTMLAKIAEFYEEEVDVAVAGLLTILEPLLICVLGVIVGTIVIAMYLPLFDIISQLSH